MKSRRKLGFTLVEVLIVVVIMAVLAAAIIPQFADSTADAKANTAIFNLHTLRSQIELYKAQHDSKYPTAGLVELTKKTNAAGEVGTSTAYRYGPYVRTIPENPINGLNSVVAPAANPPVAEEADAGWLYDAVKGEVWINSTKYLTK